MKFSNYNITFYEKFGCAGNKKQKEILSLNGDFSLKSRYLSLEQNLGGQSAVTFYFTAKESTQYQKVNILSGFLAQIIYLKSTIKQIGCSGIGAYYDQNTRVFTN